jgi:hypothetical protein
MGPPNAARPGSDPRPNDLTTDTQQYTPRAHGFQAGTNSRVGRHMARCARCRAGEPCPDGERLAEQALASRERRRRTPREKRLLLYELRRPAAEARR